MNTLQGGFCSPRACEKVHPRAPSKQQETRLLFSSLESPSKD